MWVEVVGEGVEAQRSTLEEQMLALGGRAWTSAWMLVLGMEVGGWR